MLAVIGGSGFARVPGFRPTAVLAVATPWGEPSAPLQRGLLQGQELILLPRHGDPHHLPPHRINYRANLRALADAGVGRILAINTVGGISPLLRAGDFVVPHDLIDYSWGREHTYSDGSDGSVLQHIDFTHPFDLSLRARISAGLRRRGVAHHDGGIYAVAQGPRLETAAEIRRFGQDGCDVVGMTAMPEAGLARELRLPYAMLCLVVNPAAGRAATPVSLAGMAQVQAAAAETVAQLIADVAAGA